MGKKFDIFSVRHFEGILSPGCRGNYAVGCKNEQGKSGEHLCRFPTDKKTKGGTDNGHEAGKIGPQHGKSKYAAPTSLSLVTIKARIYELVKYGRVYFVFKLVLSFCVEWRTLASVSAFVKESSKKQEHRCERHAGASAVF